MFRGFDLLVVALFAGTVVLVLGAAAWEAGRTLLERTGRARPRSGRGYRLYRRTVLALAGAGCLCILYGRFVEPRWPETTFRRVELARLPPGARPLRLVHLTDLHCDPEPLLEERLPGLVAAVEPDLVVYTGDSANEPAGLPLFRRTVDAIAAVAPVFGVEGNWDTVIWPGSRPFRGTRATELNGRAVRFEKGGTALWIAGLPYDRPEAIDAALKGIPPGEPVVFLYHTPDLVYDLADRRVDLVCAGHTHGGQVALPFYGALVTLSRFGKRFEGGIYRVGTTWLSVSRGIGMEGGAAPRVRFCARPEITVIDLVPAAR